MSSLTKLKWQCRRGTLELDQLLTSYLDTQFSTAEKQEQQAFIALLTLEDNRLQSLLLGDERADTETLRLLTYKIRNTLVHAHEVAPETISISNIDNQSS